MRKDILPYDYIDAVQKLQETKLSPKFCKKLKDNPK